MKLFHHNLFRHSEQREESPTNVGFLRRAERSFGKTPQDDKKSRTIKTASAILAVVLVLSGLTVSLVSIFNNPPLVKAAWYNASWNYRQKITIDHNKVPNTDQTDFPVLIKITPPAGGPDNAIFTKAQADGDDLLFTSSNETTKLSHEIERFSTSSNDKELIAWVKIPTLSHTTDTTIYLYYGNAAASNQQSVTDVWSNGYVGVYHMSQVSGNATDAIAVRNLLNAGSITYSATGKVGNSVTTDGSSAYFRDDADDNAFDFAGDFTIQGWGKSTQTDQGTIIQKGNYGGSWTGWFLGIGSTSKKGTFGVNGTNLVGTADRNDGNFHYYSGVRSGTSGYLYEDGSQAATGTVGSATTDSDKLASIGARYNTTGTPGLALYLNGGVDEIRVSSTARSADWIATEYANQNSPETFIHINGEVGKDNYTIPTQPAGWYAPDWAKRQPILLNPTHTKVPNTDQTDFPTLIKLTDVSNDLWANAQADGDDILFADSSGNKLAHEIEQYTTTPGSKALWAWVKIPTLLTASNTTIYMYYGNANAPNQQSRTAVWSNGYAGVWHMNDAAASTTVLDSLATNNGTAQANTSTKTTTGQNSNALTFNGGSDYITIPPAYDDSMTTQATFSAWVKLDNDFPTVGYGGFMFLGTGGNDFYPWTGLEAGYIFSSIFRSNRIDYIDDGSFNKAQWHYVNITSAPGAGNWKFYQNTSVLTSNIGEDNIAKPATPRIGRNAGTDYLDGNLDDVRISSIARSSDWIATEYANQNDPATFETFGAAETSDTFAPTNPSSVIGYQSSGGALITNNAGSDSTPYYSWPQPEADGGASDQTGQYISGVAGYYSYFGTSCGGGGADPAASRGVLSDTGSGLHYSSDINVSVPDLTTNEDDYCFRIKTKDNAGNVSAVTQVATYTYDTTNPNAPSFVAANPAGYSSVNSFDFTWPVATDNVGGSGLAGYQYKRGGISGDDWSATQAGTSKTAILSYQSGANIFLVRSIDNAGNTSSQVQTTYYYSNEVPTKPTGISATPGVSDSNSFAFSWTAPVHSRPIVDYGYVINAVPTTGNLTWTGSASTSLAADAFATAQGVNTFYIVAKDDSGAFGVDVANYGTATFTCTTVAPPIPTGVSITDSSNRTIDLWALTIKWSAGAGQGASFDHYSIERATDPSASSGPTAFAEVATSTGTAYIDTTGLNNTTTYYYRIKAVDTANSPSAASSTVSKMPTGKYTTPPTIVTEPSVSIKATQATISWVVSRASTSAVRFGTVESDLSRSQIDPTTQTGQSISLVGLEPATKYYYQVQALDADRDYTSESAYSVVYNFTTLAAPSIANVSVSNITLNTADITWETSSASNTKVYFGPTISYGTVLPESDDSMTTRHNIKLRGLTHTSKYHYKIYGSDIDGNILSSDDYTFETLPMPVISQISYQPDFTGPSPQVTIFWLTNVPTTSSVEYSPKDAADTLSFEESQSALVTNHKVTLSNMQNSTDYTFKLSGRDQFGNLVESDLQVLNTGADMRPPTISDVFAETSNIGSGNKDLAQAVISWKTDEPATSEVEYDTGINGTTYRKKTSADSGLSTDHIIIISDLEPQTPYHFHVISKDESDNESQSPDQTIITGATSGSIFNLIMRVLNSLFGWLQPH